MLSALGQAITEHTGGNPCGPEKWVRRSLRHLSQKLSEQIGAISSTSISRLLKQQKYSLKSNRKCINETQHPQRDRQFRYLNRVKRLFLNAGHPVISVDTKKKELIGNFKTPGQQWCHQAEAVNVHDLPAQATFKAVPYGIYDLTHNHGFVYVGTSADTPDFAVDAIAAWFQRQDRPRFDDESKLLILCDAGGSNGYRIRNWKKRLQEVLADRFQLQVMVCHYPTGASKWNPIEHRLFSFISMNWAAIPLRSLAQMTALIRGTTTRSGLVVKAAIAPRLYKTGVKVSDTQMAQLNLSPRRICPQWNYVLSPRHPHEKRDVIY